MESHIKSVDISRVLGALMEETFDSVQGFYLDAGTTMFETLADVSAEEASIPVGGRCATLAVQVKHVAFTLDYLEHGVRGNEFPEADWEEIWRSTTDVTEEEWEAIKQDLRTSYDRVKKLISEMNDWPGTHEFGSALTLIIHSAYHLGEIRQALCVLKDGT